MTKEVKNKTYNFRRKEKETVDGYLEQVYIEDLMALMRHCMERPALDVWVVAKAHVEQFRQDYPEKGVTLEDIRKAKFYSDSHVSYSP